MIHVSCTCDDPVTREHLKQMHAQLRAAKHAARGHLHQALKHLLHAGISALDAHHTQCEKKAAAQATAAQAAAATTAPASPT